MIKILLGLLIIATLLDADTNPYDNPLTKENKELYAEFRSFVRKILRANIRRALKVRFKPKETSCKNRCNEPRSKTFYCHCDVNCQLYGDCCYDIWKSTICNRTETVKQTEQNRWKCVSDLHRKSTTIKKLYWYDHPAKYPRIKGHMMISSCPNPRHALQDNCTHPDANDTLGRIPVEGKHNQTYRNKYCALCNGNNQDNITYWRYELFCSPRNIAKQGNETSRLHNCLTGEPNENCSRENRKYVNNNCTWYYSPPNGHSKNYAICSPVETCPQTPVINIRAFKYYKLTLKCQAYMRIVFHNGTYYKNFHCALCHGIDPLQLENAPSDTGKPTLSMFFEIPQPRVQRHVNTLAATNETNTTGLQNNGSTLANSKSKVLPGEGYLTLAGFLVSMVSLVILLILYSKVKSLQTTPGKIIIGLSISIIVYQVLLFISQTLTEKAVACSITAIFLHLAVLSSFAWMSVMSFDVWKTFGKNGTITVAKNSTFQFYVLYVVINPLVIVVTAVVVDQTGLMSVYWRNKEMDSSFTSCWIIKPLSHFLFFVIPVGLSLGLNIIAFIWTIIGITSAQNKSKKLQSSRKSKSNLLKNLKMWVKLSVVMGMTWLLGFTIELSSVMRYIYVVLNSFQGFFIFLAFVTNKRVIEKYRSSRPSQTTPPSRWNTARQASAASDTKN